MEAPGVGKIQGLPVWHDMLFGNESLVCREFHGSRWNCGNVFNIPLDGFVRINWYRRRRTITMRSGATITRAPTRRIQTILGIRKFRSTFPSDASSVAGCAPHASTPTISHGSSATAKYQVSSGCKFANSTKSSTFITGAMNFCVPFCIDVRNLAGILKFSWIAFGC